MKSLKLERIDAQLRWMKYARIAIKALESMPVKATTFNDIRSMNRYELRTYIRTHQEACNNVKRRRYSPDDAKIASKVVYAQNRLILM